MKTDKFWKLVAVAALMLLAVAVLRPSAPGGEGGSSLFVSSAQAGVGIRGEVIFTTSNDGRSLYVWYVSQAEEPQFLASASAR
jgi:hypothetical protein